MRVTLATVEPTDIVVEAIESRRCSAPSGAASGTSFSLLDGLSVSVAVMNDAWQAGSDPSRVG